MPGNELSAAGDEIAPSLFAETSQLSYLAGNVFAGGMVLGTTSSRGEIMIDVIRAVPTRITLLCADPWLARLLIVRVAGMGSNAVIATDRATAWEYFVNVIGGQKPLATVRTDHASALPAPSVGTPLVVVEDARDVPPETYAPRLAWQTTIHVRAGVNERSRTLFDASHVVLVCRLGADAATAVSSSLGLGDNGPSTVAALADHEVLVIADRRAHRVSVTPTPTERRMI
ncbi:MAG: hypothetical protein QOE17_2268 [Gaiellales bacterium]|jgi:hypothetical protein|nr:hypothetical protein [Gaiellales bacterium]